jgi:hypothetical protein
MTLTTKAFQHLNDLKVAITHIALLTTENKKLKAKNKKFMSALKKIAEDYVEIGELNDCPGCEYDGRFCKTHHEECVYVVAKEALRRKESRYL